MAKSTPDNSNKLAKKDTIQAKLTIPKDLLSYQARKIQIMIRRLDRLAVLKPGEVNLKDYVMLLKEFGEIVERIKANEKDRMVAKRRSGAAQDLGEGTPDGEPAGISANNPFTR